MLFDDILRGAEGRFADGLRRIGSRLEMNRGELDRIASEQRREADDLRERGRTMKEVVDARYSELDNDIETGESAFTAHMLDLEKTISTIRADSKRKLGKAATPTKTPVDGCVVDTDLKGHENVEQ